MAADISDSSAGKNVRSTAYDGEMKKAIRAKPDIKFIIRGGASGIRLISGVYCISREYLTPYGWVPAIEVNMFRATISTLAVLLFACGGAMAQDGAILIEYETFTVADPGPASYWKDMLPKLFPDAAPARILVSEMPTSGGGTYVVTQLLAGGWCGLDDCPTRIVENGSVIADFMACQDVKSHFLSADGTTLSACGVDFDVQEMTRAIEQFGAPF